MFCLNIINVQLSCIDNDMHSFHVYFLIPCTFDTRLRGTCLLLPIVLYCQMGSALRVYQIFSSIIVVETRSPALHLLKHAKNWCCYFLLTCHIRATLGCKTSLNFLNP